MMGFATLPGMRSAMPRLVLVAGVFACSFCAATVSRAQIPVPAHISVTEGTVAVDRESGTETGLPDLPLVEGDRVRTEQGRAEIVLGDGSALHMDAQTSIDVNGASIVRLLSGRLVVFGEPSAVGALQIDAAPASVRLTSSGESRISLYDGGARLVLDVAVVRGAVEILTDGGTSYVQAGQRVLVEEGALPSTPVPFNSAQMDSFYRWSAELLDQRRGTQSAAYLPDELTSYASDFDNSGAWSYLAPYGYVWYPSVGTGWCPYSHGRWAHVGHGVGWSFVGNGGRWTYPTHHYGRWGMNSTGGWFWIPGATWGSAWVQWAVSSNHVGWCPLGWNDRPVVGWDGGPVVTPYGRHGGPWRAWTVVPKTTFARGGSIGRTPVDPQALRGASQAFVVQREAPRVIVPRVSPGTLTPRVSTTGSVSTMTGSVATRTGSVAPRTGTVATRTGSIVPRTGSVATRTGTVSTVPAATMPAAPPVIYHRGTPIPPDTQRNPASVYDRAGVAVPRGLPADAATAPGTAYVRGGAVVTRTPGNGRSTATPQIGSGAPAPTGGGTMRTTPAPAAPAPHPAAAPPAPPATATPAPRAAPPATSGSSGIPVAHPGGGPKH
jgi:uncharacterized protein DUF6600/FecR-like protein